jgi:hypothetical protein
MAMKPFGWERHRAAALETYSRRVTGYAAPLKRCRP